MCGLFARFGSAISAAHQQAVLAALKGRGPNAQGSHLEHLNDKNNNWITLLHTRLAIQDLSPLGNQPMTCPEAKLSLVFNGEIYNQLELRQELERCGICFRSNSDTEVLLHGYRHWGADLWGKLNGIFAVAIWDGMRQELCLARDGCGVKPLLWQRQGTFVTVASELSAFEAASLASRRKLSINGLHSYALWGAVDAPHTMLQGVEVFPAGHFVICNGNAQQVPQPFPAPLTAPKPLDELLAQAVARQAIGNQPVGLFLSGGLDSGLLAALLRKHQQGPIHSLAIGFEQLSGAVDETNLAALTANHLQLSHQRVLITAQALEAAFEPFLAAIDQPSIDGFNTFLVAQAARAQGMVVAFSGLGADELFYGYGHMGWPKPLQRLACRRIPASGLTPWRKHSLLRQRAERCGSAGASIEECSSYMANTLLRDSDAVTMAHGLELRVPFLDPDLIAFAKTKSAAEHLMAGPKTLLRQQAQALLPTEILQGPKRGFNLPLTPWLTSNKRFTPRRLVHKLAQIDIPAQAIWRSWYLMQVSPRRYAPYWRWVVLSEWLSN